MNKRLLISLLAGWCLALSLAGCKDDDETIDPSSAEPVITFVYDELDADLNLVDNLPVVAVIKSEAGLKSVALSILTSEGETVPVTTVTEFFNDKSYSLAEEVEYEADYTEAVIEAVDKLDRRVKSSMPISVTDIVEAPSITFDPASIEYDERDQVDMPATGITVTTSALLASVELTRVKTTGQVDYASVSFDPDEGARSTWTYNEVIPYDEFDTGLKVRAVDSYGQVTIQTLPVHYTTVAPPVLTFAQSTITADKDEQKAVEVQIESEGGLAKVELYRLEGSNEERIKSTDYSNETSVAYAETMTFTNKTTGVKVVATDRLGRSATATADALVNLYYVQNILVNTAPANDGVDGGNRMLSISDRKSYSVQACFDDPSLQSHIDVAVYYMTGNANLIRIYDIAKNPKPKEYSAAGGTLQNFTVKNATTFAKSSLNFESATAADIQAIDPSSVISTVMQGGEDMVGSVWAVKLAPTSPAAGKVALLKLVSVGEPSGTNKNARTFTFAVKLPKE